MHRVDVRRRPGQVRGLRSPERVRDCGRIVMARGPRMAYLRGVRRVRQSWGCIAADEAIRREGANTRCARGQIDGVVRYAVGHAVVLQNEGEGCAAKTSSY